MKLLLHICCAPCATYPVENLRAEGVEPTGYFYNPNIHPYREFKHRLQILETYASAVGLSVLYDRTYAMEEFLRAVTFHERGRCAICYALRLQAAARVAKEGGFTHLSTTLLVSPYQQHELIREIGTRAAQAEGLTFFYRDFRLGWRRGVELAQTMDLYRQPYCGCIYSEAERYCRAYRKKGRKVVKAQKVTASKVP